ncbi:MAG: hypothetical protein NC311_20300 [Muribaculaceae bacterium]|nr:hypothetical protein [Muribaculaceae bacterium]MCM1297885.1 hypothetical protein [Muribaculaceae bacterium]
MKTADDLMTWPKPKEEVLFYALLMLRECKTRADVEAVCNTPAICSWGYREAIKELVEALPQILITLNAIYGDEKGGAK